MIKALGKHSPAFLKEDRGNVPDVPAGLLRLKRISQWETHLRTEPGQPAPEPELVQ